MIIQDTRDHLGASADQITCMLPSHMIYPGVFMQLTGYVTDPVEQKARLMARVAGS